MFEKGLYSVRIKYELKDGEIGVTYSRECINTEEDRKAWEAYYADALAPDGAKNITFQYKYLTSHSYSGIL